MASAAKTNGVPQAGPGIINQHNFSDSHKPAQNWANTVKSVLPKMTQVADQPKFVQVQPMNASYSVSIIIFFDNLDHNI